MVIEQEHGDLPAGVPSSPSAWLVIAITLSIVSGTGSSAPDERVTQVQPREVLRPAKGPWSRPGGPDGPQATGCAPRQARASGAQRADLLPPKEALEGTVPGVLHSLGRSREQSRVNALTAADLMTKPAVTIGPDEPVTHAARLMYNKRVKRLPVISDDGTADRHRDPLRRAERVQPAATRRYEREITEDLILGTFLCDPATVHRHRQGRHRHHPMKAAVVPKLGGKLEIIELSVPEPGPGQVLIRMLASGLCHTDIHAARGDWPVKPKPPFIPGHEGVGIVERTGPGATLHQVGDRVAMAWLGPPVVTAGTA